MVSAMSEVFIIGPPSAKGFSQSGLESKTASIIHWPAIAAPWASARVEVLIIVCSARRLAQTATSVRSRMYSWASGGMAEIASPKWASIYFSLAISCLLAWVNFCSAIMSLIAGLHIFCSVCTSVSSMRPATITKSPILADTMSFVI